MFVGTESHLDNPNEWAVDFKVCAPAGADPATPELLDRVRMAMARPDVAVTFRGDQEKFLRDDGSVFVVHFWAAGETPAAAFRAARRDVLAVLEQIGLDGWTLVRFKARTPRHVYVDTFPGVDNRIPIMTEETR